MPTRSSDRIGVDLISDLQAAVLLHHKKLDQWFQPGGHVDGNPNLLESALREA